MGSLRRLLLLLLFAAFVVGGLLGWRLWREWNAPNVRTGGQDRYLLIPSGAGFATVVDSLTRMGVLLDAEAFRFVAERKNYPDRVKPGRYRIREGMTSSALVDLLRSGDQEEVRVTFTNVEDLDELAERLAEYLEPDVVAFKGVLFDPQVHERHRLRAETFISLFLPDTYRLYWNTTPDKFVERMAREHAAYWTDERKKKAAVLGLDPVQVATLASIVQAETNKREEAPRIAGVYLNRLRIGMPLQADPTLKFARGLRDVNRVLDVDKQVDSPYNTYRNKGLPPGPINMAEKRSIEAVLGAEKHDYLYFCAREDLSGYSNFARTYEQHLVNARRYQRALNERKIFR